MGKEIDKFAELERVFGTRKPIIGMVHLAPLPGSPRYDGTSMNEIAEMAIADARLLRDAGFDGAIIENFGDIMFLKKVRPETIAAMTFAAAGIAKAVPDLVLGLCVLQSDAIAALAIAHVIGGKFVRVPYYTETYIVDAGMMESIAAEALRFRKYLNMDVKIFADVHIKHGYPLSQRPISHAARDIEHRGMADAILVTGLETGYETEAMDVKEVKEAVDHTPVLVASGVDEFNFPDYKDFSDGVIIGTRLKQDNDTEGPLDPEKIRRFIQVVNKNWAK